MDFTSFFTDAAEDAHSGGKETAEVREWNMVTKMFSQVTTNDLASLRVFIEEEDDTIKNNAQAVEYGYNVTPYIYTLTDGDHRQVNPDTALERTNAKFIRRFGYVEQQTIAQGKNMKDMTLSELDALWNEAKSLEKADKK